MTPVVTAGPRVDDVLRRGGVLARALRWRGRSTEIRVTVRRDDGARVYDLREWYLDHDADDWRPGRRGMNGLAGAELRSLLALLVVVAPLVPRRGSPRGRRAR